MYTIPEINFTEITGRDGHLGLITLQRVNALNALNHTMIHALNNQLIEWEAANHIKAVVIHAAPGRAFCAGGDIRALWQHKMAHQTQLANFFRDEYQLNRRIHHFSKPYIALLDGITMGGGVGISIHASHRLATKNLVWAMPETAIGFFPDVGTTYFLARLPDDIGVYLGLTGARITRDDAVALGLIDHAIGDNVFHELIYALADTVFNGDAYGAVTEALTTFTEMTTDSTLLQHRSQIAAAFSQKTVEEILAVLDAAGDAFSQATAASLRSKSPTSLKVTLRAIQQAATLEFDDCLAVDYALVHHFLAGADFFTGIHAAVIDRTAQPVWQPASLAEIEPARVEEYFVLPDEAEALG